MKITACMIAKNEEKNIEMCINSYKSIVDEMIVVDTGSEDNTVEIAKGLGAKVYFFDWINDFAAAKNYALDRAKGDWIIFLDADEYFDVNSTRRIRKILESLKGSKYSAVGCKIINIDKVNDRIIDSFMQLRIFKNDKNIRYQSSIHESLKKKNDKIHIISFYDDIEIYHTGYSSNVNKEKAKRNLEILLDDVKSNGENEEHYRYLCDCYFSLGDYENALKYGKLHLESNIKLIGYESRIHKVVIDCMWKLGKSKNEIETKIKECINVFPDHPNFYCSYGFFLLDEKRYEEALSNFLLALNYNDSYKGIEVNLIIGLIHYIHSKIGFIYEMKNCYEKAIEHYYLSLKMNKHNKDVFFAAFKIIKQQKFDDAIDFLNSIYDINDELDVKFVIDELIKIKPKLILLYYTNIWYKKMGYKDSSLTFTLLAEEKYETAYKIFYNGYLEEYDDFNAILAIVSSFLSNNNDNIRSLLKIVKPSYKRIIMSYLGESVSISEIDRESYKTIFRELIVFNQYVVLKRFLELCDNFSSSILFEIANIFMDNGDYNEAAKYYMKYSEKNEDKNVLMYIGYCSYKLKEYNIAYINIKKAIENGYDGNDAYDFLKWIEEQRVVI